MAMTDLLRSTRSPVSVTIMRARSPGSGRCSSGKECLRAQVRAKSADERQRSLNSSAGLSNKHLLKPMTTGVRSMSSERPRSARRNQQGSGLLDIPSITIHDAGSEHSTRDKNDNSYAQNYTNRSRSPSPFDWITREKLPCGSPSFEKVMCDMLSDIEISPRSSDTEHGGEHKEQNNKKKSKPTLKHSQRKTYRKTAKNKIGL